MTVSIKDVARVAGVSPATVSRVLGNGTVVSDALRAQVEAAVRKTGYRPNLSARRLRSRHSQTIGLIVADIRNPFFTAVGRAVEDIAYQAGLRVILCNTDENPEKEALYLRLMEEERVTGVIFAPTRQTVDRMTETPQSFPTVLIDRACHRSQEDAVVLDNHASAGMLVEHLHAQGYRRMIGLFGNASTTGIERHDGYIAAMTRFGLTPDAVFIPPTSEAAEAEVRRRIAEGVAARPDAVIASNGLLLMGVVRAVREAGLVIPGDLAVAGFDNERWTELVGPGITVIEQPVEAIGRTAMAMLLERLDTPDAPIRKVVLNGRCVVRGSTAARRTSRAV
ncbi:LacI family DNA-binding transcriptional regulator [Telmatospirillum siberiense]|uniref:LacI family transcriptional regulator n=1 Tax=Telmatospirillum siberiense TaxID=382514 RepID=A0A2N3PXF0_9PROT|nr:LacI family DNA-binding transcriptional regulator [Telmatospirillum siberiense]PKU25067.1 LacI family transcriptional regulator [Telmatospirillum siberiense]